MNLSVKNVPEDLVERLRQRAKRNHRSLQNEVLTILEGSVGPGPITVRELYDYGRGLNYSSPSESVQIIRELRDSR